MPRIPDMACDIYFQEDWARSKSGKVSLLHQSDFVVISATRFLVGAS